MIVYSIPESQIECERVFSLLGVLTASRRNRMGSELMPNLAFLRKNTNSKEEMPEWAQAMEKAHGMENFDQVSGEFGGGGVTRDGEGGAAWFGNAPCEAEIQEEYACLEEQGLLNEQDDPPCPDPAPRLLIQLSFPTLSKWGPSN